MTEKEYSIRRTRMKINTGCFFFFGLSQGAVNQLYEGVLSSFCTFCIAKYGRTAKIELKVGNPQKDKAENWPI